MRKTRNSMTGITRRQLRVVTLSSGGGFVDGYDLIMMGSAIILIQPAFDLSAAQVGMLTAAAYAGAFVAATAAGYFTDVRGRRAAFIVSLGCLAFASVCSAIAPEFWTLLVARFLVGIGIGIDLPTSGAMTAEFVPARSRGAALASWQLLWTTGALLSPLVAVALLPVGDDAWRYMFATCAIPALAILLARRTIPETPRWLRLHGKADQAEEVRQWAGEGLEQAEEQASTRSQWQQTVDIFRGPHRRNVLVVSVLCICGSVASLFLGSYSSFLAKFVGATTDRAAILFGMVIWGAYLLGNIVNLLVTDRLGRKPMLIAGGIATTVALGAAAFVGLDADHVAIIFVIFAGGAFCYWGGVNAAIWQYSAELFPTSTRATARGFTTGWTRFAAMVTGFTTPILIESAGFGTTMLIFALFGAGTIVCGFLLPEVKGKTLDEIAQGNEISERKESHV